MGNFSSDPQTVLQDALEKSYRQVRFQQGEPLLDRELNLQADLNSPQRLATHHIGNGVPVNSDGFRIDGLDVPSNDFSIAAGRCLVNGHSIVLDADTTYQTQPLTDNVETLPAGTSSVYLRVFSREVTGSEDPDLLNSGEGDVGFETTVREKTEWEVLVTSSTISSSDHFLLAEIDTNAANVADRRLTDLTLASTTDEVKRARGSAGQLSARLDTSLAADGALNADSVTEGAILDGAVTTNKIDDQAVTQGKIADQAVSITQLKQTLVFDGSVSINPNAEVSVNLVTGQRHAQLMISARVSDTDAGPRGFGNISWSEFYLQFTIPTFPGLLFANRGIRISNTTAGALTVEVQAYELMQS